MLDCWELRPDQFKLKLEADPQFLPNSRQISLLKDSGRTFNLNYLYEHDLISWVDYCWNLFLSADPDLRTMKLITQNALRILSGQISWEELKSDYTVLSARLSTDQDPQWIQTLLIYPRLSLLVQKFGLLTPLLRTEIRLTPDQEALFRPLDWDFLRDWGHYVVKIPGTQLNQRTLDSLKQLEREDFLRFNQLFSQSLESVTLSQRKILASSDLALYLFNILFYDQPEDYSLTPLLQQLDYLLTQRVLSPKDFAAFSLTIYRRQSESQKHSSVSF